MHPLTDTVDRLCDAVDALSFGEPVTHVYNPLRYARAMNEQYMERFATKTPRPVVMVGMNPGPWGMAQSGVPFGDVVFVREWMGIEGVVEKPAHEHPARPVEGLACGRNEVSGSRLWGWARERYGAPERFFERFFVWNYCPLSFMEESGRNFTPNKLPVAQRRALFAPCDQALREVVEHLQPAWIVGIGAFAEKRIEAALKKRELLGPVPKVGRVLHPSPASPKANRGWAEQAEAELEAMGIGL